MAEKCQSFSPPAIESEPHEPMNRTNAALLCSPTTPTKALARPSFMTVRVIRFL